MAENVIAYAQDWAQEAREQGSPDYDAVRKSVQQRATENHPVYLGIVTAVVYNDKTDRYIVKFGEGSSVKADNAAAEFLLTHAFNQSARPTVNGHITNGLLDGVLLLFLAR